MSDAVAKLLIQKIDEEGGFPTIDDGFSVYCPPITGGIYSANTLRIIANELDKRNVAWQERLTQCFIDRMERGQHG